MKTIEEMRKEIEMHCDHTEDCKNCDLKDKGVCYATYENKKIIENYNILFGKEEQKILNIDKYKDEISELALQYNDYTKAIITCCSKHNKGLFVDYNVAIYWLFQEYKEPIQLTQFEYDLLRTNDQPHSKKIKGFKTYMHMKNVGHYKGVKNWDMTIKEILDNCVIENEQTR